MKVSRTTVINASASISRAFLHLSSYVYSNVTKEHINAMHMYLQGYTGSNYFLNDVARYPTLSARQIVGVIRCMTHNFREYVGQEDLQIRYDSHNNVVLVKRTETLPTPIHAIDDTVYTIPQCGTYTVLLPNGDYRTLRVKPSDWRGIARVIEYLNGPDNHSDYKGCASVRNDGTLQVWSRFNSETILVGAIIMLLSGNDDVVLESAACNRCGRKLTVPASLHAGYGPDCAKQIA